MKEESLFSFQLTNHAKKRLKERRISLGEIEKVFNNPERTYLDILTERFVAIGPRDSRPGHWLIIIYEKHNQLRRVISILDTTTIEKITSSREGTGRWLRVR